MWLASPDLHSRLRDLLARGKLEEDMRAIEAAEKYHLRMAWRATPFGQMATVTLGHVGSESVLRLQARQDCQPHTRVDMGLIHKLATRLHAGSGGEARYLANETLFRKYRRWHYVAPCWGNGKGMYVLKSVPHTQVLGAIIGVGQREELTRRELMALVGRYAAEATVADQEAYVTDLIESKVLLPSLRVSPTARNPMTVTLDEAPACSDVSIRSMLREVDSALAKSDMTRGRERLNSLRRIAERLGSADLEEERGPVVQVDVYRPAAIATLGECDLRTVCEGIRAVYMCAPQWEGGLLEQFRRSFLERYGLRSVPLLEALDPELGPGFQSGEGLAKVPGGPFEGVAVEPGQTTGALTWGRREEWLLRGLLKAVACGSGELHLDLRELKGKAFNSNRELPDSFAAIAVIGEPTGARSGARRVLIKGVTGPSAVKLLGRFSHLNDELMRAVQGAITIEQELSPNALMAEVVHLPEGHVGNVIARPRLRDAEIPILCGTSAGQVIPLRDLEVSVDTDRIVLKSKRLGVEVVPRLTSAHNYMRAEVSLYKFLCALQLQGCVPSLAWSWGPLESAPFLPRVTAGNAVLCRARWRMTADDLREAVSTLSRRRSKEEGQPGGAGHLPRYVEHVTGDQELPYDLSSPSHIERLLHECRITSSVTLQEVWPPLDGCYATGPEGRYRNEVIIPFHRVRRERIGGVASGGTGEGAFSRATTAPRHGSSTRRFWPPGERWVYLRILCAPGLQDHLLLTVGRGLAKRMHPATDTWHFVRYADPEPHLRLRFLCTADADRGEQLQAVCSFMKRRRVGDEARWSMETYEREMERYGGPRNIELVEMLFGHDSDTALAMLDLCHRTGRTDLLWLCGLASVHQWLDDMSIPLDRRRQWLAAECDALAHEYGIGAVGWRQLAKKYRKWRQQVESMTGGVELTDHDRAIHRILRRRSIAVARVLRGAERGHCGRCIWPEATARRIVMSMCHMSCNRLYSMHARAHEMLVYGYLGKAYESARARGRGG